MERNLYAYEYLNRRGSDLVRMIHEDQEVLIGPTESAAQRAETIKGRLNFHLGGFEVGQDVICAIGEMTLEPGVAHIPVRWKAASHSSLFPYMNAEIEIQAISDQPPESRIGIVGFYTPPLGPLGAVGDLLVGHQVAEAAVRQFVTDLALRLDRYCA